MKIYLSGPMTGLPDYNRAAFREAADFYRSQHFQVRDPSRIVLEPKQPDEIRSEWQRYMVHAVRMLLECDAIVMLDGWEDSKGARIEHDLAVQLGLRLTYDRFLRDALCGKPGGLFPPTEANK